MEENKRRNALMCCMSLQVCIMTGTLAPGDLAQENCNINNLGKTKGNALLPGNYFYILFTLHRRRRDVDTTSLHAYYGAPK